LVARLVAESPTHRGRAFCFVNHPTPCIRLIEVIEELRAQGSEVDTLPCDRWLNLLPTALTRSALRELACEDPVDPSPKPAAPPPDSTLTLIEGPEAWAAAGVSCSVVD